MRCPICDDMLTKVRQVKPGIYECLECHTLWSNYISNVSVIETESVVRPDWSKEWEDTSQWAYFDFECFLPGAKKYRRHGWYDRRDMCIVQIG